MDESGLVIVSVRACLESAGALGQLSIRADLPPDEDGLECLDEALIVAKAHPRAWSPTR